jgi:hypothetical protein
MRTGLRVAVGIVLLFGVVGLCIHYGATYDTNWPHPTGEQLATDYDEYVDDRILLIGEVQSTDPVDETLTIEITDDADEVAAEIEIHDTTAAVEPGGTVQAYGTLQAAETMTATETVVVNHGPTESQYKLAVSVVGILLAIGYFLTQWQLNLQQLTFNQRSTTTEADHNG